MTKHIRTVVFLMISLPIIFVGSQNATLPANATLPVTGSQNVTLPKNNTQIVNSNNTVVNSTTAASIPPTVTTTPSPVLKNLTAIHVPVNIKVNDTEESAWRSFAGFFDHLGNNCSNNSQCLINNSICKNGSCQCDDDYTMSNSQRECLEKAKELGGRCREDVQCTEGLGQKFGPVYCVFYKCECDPNTSTLKNGTCVEKIHLGGSCKSDDECTVPDSVCIQNICACKHQLIPHPNNRDCLPAVRDLKSDCSLDAQCQEHLGSNSRCIQRNCVCLAAHHFNGSQCVADLELGAPCTEASDCDVSEQVEDSPRRTCKENKCVCADGFSQYQEENFCKGSASGLAVTISLLAAGFMISFIFQ